MVDHHHIHQISIVLRDTGGRDLNSGHLQHIRCRSLNRLAADYWADTHDACCGLPDRFAHASNTENRVDTHHRITWADEDDVGILDCIDKSIRRRGIFDTVEANSFYIIGMSPADEVLLKIEPAICSLYVRVYRIIGHGDDARFDTQSVGKLCGNLGQELAISQSLCTENVRGEILITKQEPRVLTESGDGIQRGAGITSNAPTLLYIGQSAQCVEHSIDIRANLQAPDLQIIGCIDDCGQTISEPGRRETIQHAGPTDSSCQSRYSHLVILHVSHHS